MLKYENGYLVEYKDNRFNEKCLANQFKVKSEINDNKLILNHLTFVNHFEDYVISNGSEYIESEAHQIQSIDEETGLPLFDEDNNPVMIDVEEVIANIPSFDEEIDLKVNDSIVNIQFTQGVATLDISSYTEHTTITTNLASTDNVNIELNKPYSPTIEDMIKYNYYKSKGVI